MLVTAGLFGCTPDTPQESHPRAFKSAETRNAPFVWGGEQRLVASDAAELDQFGYAVALDDGRALIGAYGENDYAGAAYVFVYKSGTWVPEQKLVPSDASPGDYFGWSVALTGNHALVGAYAKDSYRGAVYAFVRDGDSWLEEQKLFAGVRADFDRFGTSVSLHGDRALIGAYGTNESRGAAYVFRTEGDGVWAPEQAFLARDAAEQDGFGYSVALTADRAIIGAPGTDNYSGAAHVFVRNGSVWAVEQTLLATDRAEFEQFGASVAMADDRALIGAYWDDEFRGTARVFERSGSKWSEEQKLVANERAIGDRFGNAVSLSADTALVGAFGTGDSRGAAQIFVRGTTGWNWVQQLVASDGEASDLFAWSVALAPGKALIGANYTDQTRGAAYFFSLGVGQGNTCTADSECGSGHCVDEVCCDAECAGACAACSVEAGARADGTCTVFAQGSVGRTACAPHACNGLSSNCVPCQADADCSGERYCAADQTCQPRRELGNVCNDRAGEDCLLAGCRACASAFCSDGVCCDAACDGVCEGCTAVLTAKGMDGVCGPIAAGTDPNAECSDDGLPTCGRNGLCDGAGACQRYASSEWCQPETCTSGDDCTSGHCEDGICCDRTCAANERCRAALKVSGPDGVCGPARAGALGEACRFDVQCTSGHCVDGVCCDAGCGNGTPAQSAGCGCRSSRAGSACQGWLGLVLAWLWVRARRRRSIGG